MNKKHFLFVLPICLLFCLSFTTCKEEEVENNLWEKIRNTAWIGTEEKNKWYYYNGNRENMNIVDVVGFYGPKYGYYKNYISKVDSPYFVISNIITKTTEGNVLLNSLSGGTPYEGMQINRTGKEIKVNYYFSFSVDDGPTKTAYGILSFNISVTNDGETMSISNSLFTSHVSLPGPYVLDINGKYKKISSNPNFDWSNFKLDN